MGYQAKAVMMAQQVFYQDSPPLPTLPMAFVRPSEHSTEALASPPGPIVGADPSSLLDRALAILAEEEESWHSRLLPVTVPPIPM
jgi:hypothetical protein